MKHCIENEMKKIWICETSDANLFKCECCNYNSNEECFDRYFKHAFFVRDNLKSKEKSQEYLNYYDYDDNEGDYYESQNHNIDHIKQLFEQCKYDTHLPLKCLVHREYKESTICNCESKSELEDSTIVHFDTPGFWNEDACEITHEYHDVLLNQKYYRTIFTAFWTFFPVLVLLILIYFIYQKFLKKHCRKTTNFIETLMLE